MILIPFLGWGLREIYNLDIFENFDFKKLLKNVLLKVLSKHLLNNLHSQSFSSLSHFSTLGATRLVRKVSIDQLTLAGLSTNISADRPADLGWCMVTSMTS